MYKSLGIDEHGACLCNAFAKLGIAADIPHNVLASELPKICDDYDVVLVQNQDISLGDRDGIVIYDDDPGGIAHAVYFSNHEEIDKTKPIGAIILRRLES